MKNRAMYWDEDVLRVQNEARLYEEELRNPPPEEEPAEEAAVQDSISEDIEDRK